MNIDEFNELADEAMEETVSTRWNGRCEGDPAYELGCILQYLIPKLSDQDIYDAIEQYKKNYG
jgi:hypothetical protein